MGVKKNMNVKRERYIYYIICPIADNVVYVGVTNNPMSRFKGHIKKSKRGSKALIHYYIRFLMNKKSMPKFKIVSKIYQSYTESEKAEARHTEKYISTVFNEMYGNGLAIDKNKNLKKSFNNNEIDPIRYFESKLSGIHENEKS